MAKKVSKNSLIDTVISNEPILAEDFFRMGMMCIGCPMSQAETIEQGCQAHGMTNKQVDKFVEILNKKIEKKKPKSGSTKSKSVSTPAKAESAKLKKVTKKKTRSKK